MSATPARGALPPDALAAMKKENGFLHILRHGTGADSIYVVTYHRLEGSGGSTAPRAGRPITRRRNPGFFCKMKGGLRRPPLAQQYPRAAIPSTWNRATPGNPCLPAKVRASGMPVLRKAQSALSS